MISPETKYRAIVHYTHFLRSLRKVSAIYKVSKSSLHRWISNNPTGNKVRRRKKNVVDSTQQHVKELVENNPFITLDELSRSIESCCGIKRSKHTMGRIRKKCGFVRKKVSRVVDASKHIDPEKVNGFCKRHIDNSSVGNVVCIDEAGFILGDHGRYGYVSRGERLNVLAGRTLRRTKLTLLLAIAEHGIIDYKILDSNCRKTDFICFIDELSVPEGTTLLMDNIPFHHSKETMTSIERKGCDVLFIPPYSPKFNAIENVFSVLKRKFRSQCPREQLSCIDYRNLMERVLQNSIDSDFTPFFRRALAFSFRIIEGEEFVNYER
jgi:transposase